MIASQHSIGAAHYVLCVLACVCQVLGATGAAATLDSDVLIVGSGMAGLTVAHELHKAGVRSVILEATDRIGGRMYSQPWDIAGDPTRRVVVEMGAQWIHGIDHNPIYKIAQELELEMYETPVHTGRHPDKFDAFFEAEQDGTTRQLVDHQDVLKLLQGVDDFRAAVKEARKLGMPDESLQVPTTHTHYPPPQTHTLPTYPPTLLTHTPLSNLVIDSSTNGMAHAQILPGAWGTR